MPSCVIPGHCFVNAFSLAWPVLIRLWFHVLFKFVYMFHLILCFNVSCRLVDHLQGRQSGNWWLEVQLGWSLPMQASRFTPGQPTPRCLDVFGYLVLSSMLPSFSATITFFVQVIVSTILRRFLIFCVEWIFCRVLEMLDMYLETMFSLVTCISLFHWFGSFVHDIAFVAFCFEFFWFCGWSHPSLVSKISWVSIRHKFLGAC
jgi:hypothetical protein